MSYPNRSFLVDTAWLEDHLAEPSVRIFDVTGMLTSALENIAEERSYDHGHIPGAVFLDVASARGALSAADGKLPWTWPGAAEVEATMSRFGVDNHCRVVLYAASPRPGVDRGIMWCTRAWWIMHHFGADCAVLDGGWEKWLSEGRPVSKEPGHYPRATFKAALDANRGVASKDDVLAAIGDDRTTTVVDALSAASFTGGEKTPYRRPGHISGATNLPMQALLDPHRGVFVDAGTMRARFEEAGVLSRPEVITYCGGGIAATVDAFALSLLGHPNVRVYDGSLLEWAEDEKLPMSTGMGNG